MKKNEPNPTGYTLVTNESDSFAGSNMNFTIESIGTKELTAKTSDGQIIKKVFKMKVTVNGPSGDFQDLFFQKIAIKIQDVIRLTLLKMPKAAGLKYLESLMTGDCLDVDLNNYYNVTPEKSTRSKTSRIQRMSKSGMSLEEITQVLFAESLAIAKQAIADMQASNTSNASTESEVIAK